MTTLQLAFSPLITRYWLREPCGAWQTHFSTLARVPQELGAFSWSAADAAMLGATVALVR